MYLIIKTYIYLITGSLISLYNVIKFKFQLNLKGPLFKFKIKENEGFAIIGTGDSINSINNYQWNKLKNYTTVGINYFLLHEFIPNIIQLEIQSEEDSLYLFNVLKVLKCRKNEFKNSIILIKANYTYSKKINELKRKFLLSIPNELKNNLRFTIDFPIPISSISNYKKSIALIGFLGLLNRKDLFFIPHLRASIGLSTIIGVRMDCSKIIFVGVDLNDRKTFYTGKNYESIYRIRLPKTLENKPHKTNSIEKSEITITRALEILKNYIKSKPNFYVCSRKSDLIKIMQHFNL